MKALPCLIALVFCLPGLGTTTAFAESGETPSLNGTIEPLDPMTEAAKGTEATLESTAETEDPLQVSPTDTWGILGFISHPISESRTYTLSNNDDAPLNWNASSTVDWLEFSGVGSVDQSTLVTIRTNSRAAEKPLGVHEGELHFENTDTGVVRVREVTLTILPEPGQIDVTDSIAPADDLALPFENTSLGTAKTETIRIRNTDPDKDLLIESIQLRATQNSDTSASAAQITTTSVDDSEHVVTSADGPKSRNVNPTRPVPNWDRDHDSRTILVRFEDQAGALSRLSAHQSIGGRVANAMRRIPLEVVELPAKTDPRAAVAAYQAHPAVRYAEPNYRISLHQFPNDPRFDEQWNLHNTGQNGGLSGADISALDAWQRTRGSHNVVVAIIDSGIDYEHPDLADNMWTNPNPSFDDIHGATWTSGNGSVTSGDPMDNNGHGTHVAGIVGAVGDNETGITGVNWNVQLMALKFLDSDGFGSTADAVAALEYAIDNGAHITNNSWGGGSFSQALKDMIAVAGQANQLFVAAAGNENADNDSTPSYPASFDLDNIISVASSTRHDERASMSNYGANTVHLAAPGASILSTVPGGGYASSSGTSMAAPHVAGVAALMLAVDPMADYAHLKETILETVTPLSGWEDLVISGGRLNAAAALAEAVTGFQLLDVPSLPLNLPPGRSILFKTTFEPTSTGPHEASVIIESQDLANPSIEVLLTGEGVLDDLEVLDPDGFLSEGLIGGPFDPEQRAYTLRNRGNEALSWTAETSLPWLTITPSSGSLAPDSEQTVEVTINSTANALPEGTHPGNIRFTNTATDLAITVPVNLQVAPLPGRLSVTDSVPPEDDLHLPFEKILPGEERTESITLHNEHEEHDLIVEDILLLGGFREEFEEPDLFGWSQYPVHSWTLNSDHYEAASPGNSIFMQSMYTEEVWANGTFEARISRTGFNSSSAALILRASPDFNLDQGKGSAIVIGVSGNGFYFVARYLNDSFAWIQPWTESAALNFGATPNTLVASLRDNQLFLFVNDQPLWSGEAGGLFRPGRIGLAGFTDMIGATTHRFDYIDVREPLVHDVLPLSLSQSWKNAHPVDSDDYAKLVSPPATVPVSTSKTAQHETLTYSEIRNPQETFRLPDSPEVPLRFGPGESESIPLLFSPTGEGEFARTLRVVSNDPDQPEIDVSLTGSAERDPLRVLPLGGFASRGEIGGPFTPYEMTYTLKNQGEASLDWEVTDQPSWVDVNLNSGTLPESDFHDLTVSINRIANNLDRQVHTGSIDITNLETGFVRSIPVELDVRPTLCQAVKACELTWTTGGNAPWFGQDLLTFRSDLAAQSGPIGDSAESWIETTVEGPGQISFWWSVSSEQNYDFLEFHVNGDSQTAISGEVAWENVTFQLPEGEHTLRWKYIKDFIFAEGADAAWLDEVTWQQTPPKPLITTAEDRLAFGVVSLNESATRTLKVKNPGDSTLSIDSISLPDGFTADWETTTIAPGGSRDLAITFSPTELAPYGGPLTIESNAETGLHEVELSASAAPAEGALEMANEQVILNLRGEEGDERHFFVEVPPGRDWLELSISGGTGDADLYVRKGTAATLQEWDYAPLQVGNDETIFVDNPESGSWFFMVHGFEDFDEVALTARFALLDLASWAKLIGLPEDRRNRGDRHGPLELTTLQGYAFGVDPRLATTADLPRIEKSAANNEVRLIYTVHTEAVDVSIEIEASHDLIQWEPASPIAETVLSEADNVEMREAIFETDDKSALFIRTRIDDD